MIKFLNVQSAFEHYNRMLRGNGPVETRAGYQGDRLYVEHLRCGCRPLSRTEFAPDSPLERDGFEPAVPG
jgi:hypothetical protein